MTNRYLRSGALFVALSLLGAATGPAQAQSPSAHDVLITYADIALAGYTDSLTTAEEFRTVVDAFLDDPTAATLETARDSWIAMRVPYQQTEAYRFGNAIVDDWEGRVNAWPLDEGLIDYVDPTYYGSESDTNALYTANIIANPQVLINGEAIDAAKITPGLLADKLQEAGGNEANVATGYHAIEFLLWGQDLNGTGPGAGDRPASDYSLAECTHDNCDRRRQYLSAATDLLIADLQEMVANWEDDGAARRALFAKGDDGGIASILTGMGSLSYGELAGQRMKVGLLLHDPEEEHDCFSDNTYNAYYEDGVSIGNVYLGRYTRVDGSVVEGASLADYVAANHPELDKEMRAKLGVTMQKMDAMVERGETVEAYDQMIGEGNAAGNAVVESVIDALIDQTRTVQRIVTALGLGGVTIEGSDSLDSPDAVFQ